MAMLVPAGRALLAAVAAVLLAVSSAHALGLRTLHKRLSAQTKHLGPSSGAYVADLDASVELFGRRPDLALSPASNEKLFTTSTALLRFGPSARLQTSVVARNDIDHGMLMGDLYLVGGGDPSLGDAGIDALAAQLRQDGLKRVQGGVLGDDRAFDALRGSADSNFKPDADIGGQLGALVVGHGDAHPGGVARVAAARLQHALEHRGIRFGRHARRAVTTPGDGAMTLASLASPTMAELVAHTNLESDNFYAEMLLKDLGRRFGGGLGTTAAGLRVVRAEMSRLGVRATVVDGSGLSRADHVSPREVVDLLRAVNASKVIRALGASLPVAGASGTLRRRMRGTAAAGRCRAKTGTLRGVSALSGFCTAANGHLLAFSFIENRVNEGGAKDVEDRMVPEIARYDGGA